MADFPSFDKNANRPRQALEITPPEFDSNDDKSKSAEELFVEQQWRDVAAEDGAGEQHPLSINRDSDLVTDDPYTN